MRGLLILLCAPAIASALCPSDLTVQVTDTSLHAEFRTDVPGRATRARLRYGDTPSMPRRSGVKVSNHPAALSRVVNVTDIRPGVPKLYFDPQVSDLKGEHWSDYASCQAQLCPTPGPQPGGYACEAGPSGALIPYVSAPSESAPEPPQLPRHARSNPRERPVIDGTVTRLADCSAVQQALDDHGARGTKDPSLNHEIRLPAGAVCRPEQENSRAGKNLAAYTLPPKSGPGVTIITCDWKPLEGPPPGVQYAPELRTERACGFALNRQTIGERSAFQANGGLFVVAPCAAPPCTQGWRFETLVIEAGDWRRFSPRQVPVRAVAPAKGRIELAQPIDDRYVTNTEMTLNLPGIRTFISAHGAKPHADLSHRGCAAQKHSSTELGCWGMNRMTGAYEGGGYLSAAQGYRLEKCSAQGNTVTCTLAEPHGLGDFPAFPIASLQGGALRIDAEAHGWTRGAAVLIQGNSACDGIYNVESIPGPQSAKLAGKSCSGTGGVVRRLYTGRFFDLSGPGAAKLEGVHLIDFPAPNQVRAFGVGPEAAAVESGGFVYSNPKINAFFAMDDTARITWDRVLFDIGPPFRVFNVIGLGVSNQNRPAAPCDCAVLDSHVEGLHFWQPVTPGSEVVDSAQAYAPFSAIPVFVRAHVVQDLHLDGVTLRNSAAFIFFADQAGAPGPQDVTFRHLSMTLPDELVGGPHSKRLAYNLRHVVEVKSGIRLLFEGVQIQNWAAVGVSSAAPLFFSYRTTDPARLRLMQDITLRNIFMRNVPAGVSILTAGADAFAPQQPIRRIQIDNWLLDGVDYPNRQAAPHNQSLNIPRTFYDTPVGAGAALVVGGPAEDIRITRVTARRLRSKSVPNFLWLQGGRVNGFQLDRSIISYSPAGAEAKGVAAYALSTRDLAPAVTEGGSSAFLAWTDRMGQPDPHSWFGAPSAPVGVIPCLMDSNTRSPDFDLRNNAKSLADRAFECSGDDCARWNIRIAGKDRQSCAQRESLVLDQDLNGIGPFAGLGADTRELAKALGYFPAEVRGSNLVYAPLHQERCVVDHSPDAAFKTFTRVQDQGGQGDRTMPLQGAYYRILCPRSVPVSGAAAAP